MSYYRPARVSDVIEFLNDIDFESLEIEDLAAALVGQWDLIGSFSTPA